jgi:tight adherence protein B
MGEINPFVYLLVFIAGLAFSESIFLFITSKGETRQQRAARDRLRRHASRLQRKTGLEVESIVRDVTARGPILRLLTRLIPNRRPVDLWLYRAGVPMQVEMFIGLTFLIAIIGFFVGRVVLGLTSLGVVFTLFGGIPYFYIRHKKRRRMALFTKQFAEAIELLCRSLKAGHPFHTGLILAAEELEDPVSMEFSQVTEEIGLGLDPRAALQNLGVRMNTPDMPFFITAILLQRETGGDLPRVLGNLARIVRERVQFQAKVDAIVSQTKLSSNVLALFPPIFVVVISFLSPGYLDPLFLPTGPGRVVLFTAAGLTVAGWLLCRRLTRVDI